MPFNLLNLPQGVLETALNPVSAPDLTVPSAHKGLFGIHGDFRNILGILGDSLIAGNRGNPIFTPSVEAEKVSDAMSGFADNPLVAIQKLSQVNPGLAQKYYNDYLDSQVKLSAADATRKRDGLEATSKVRRIAGSMLGSATAETFGPLRDQALALAKNYGVSLDDLPSEYSEDGIKNFVRGTMDPDKLADNDRADKQYETDRNYKKAQVALGTGRLQAQTALGAGRLGVQANLGEGRLGISQQNADTREYSAHNPRSGGRGRPTAAAPARPASVAPTKKFIIENGQIKTRQPDGSYK